MFNLKTNKPQFFSAEYQLYQKTAGYLREGGGGGAPLHPLPRYAPGQIYEIYDHFRIQKLEVS